MKKVFKKVLALMLAAALVLPSTFAVVSADAAKVTVSDIQGNWAQDIIQQWLDMGLVKGYVDHTFRPGNDVSRAEFVTMVNSAMGYTEQADIQYTDVKSTDWCYKDIRIAQKMGYIKGCSSTQFCPNEPITREQATLILARVAGLQDDVSGLEMYTDKDKVSSWAKGAVGAATKAGYINGYSDKTFQPLRNLRRDEAVKMLNSVFMVTGPAKIVINGAKSVTIGSTATYKATVFDKAGTELKDEQVTWSTSKYDNVTISNEGKLTVNSKAKSGTVTVTATSVRNPLVRASMDVKLNTSSGGSGGTVPSKPTFTTIVLNGPDSILKNAEGEGTATYTAAAFDQDLNKVPGTIVWSVVDATTNKPFSENEAEITDQGLLKVHNTFIIGDGEKPQVKVIAALENTSYSASKIVNVVDQAYSVTLKGTAAGQEINTTLKDGYTADTSMYTVVNNAITTVAGDENKEGLVNVNQKVRNAITKIENKFGFKINKGIVNVNAAIDTNMPKIASRLMPKIEQQLNEKKDEMKTNLASQLQSAKDQITGVKEQLNKFDDVKDQLTEQQSNLDKAIGNLPESLAQLDQAREDLGKKKAEITVAQQKAVELKAQLEAMTSTPNIQTQIADLTNKINLLNQQLLEIANASAKLDEVDNLILQMEGRLGNVQSTIDAVAGLSAAELRGQLDQASGQIDPLLVGGQLDSIVDGIGVETITGVTINQATMKLFYGDKAEPVAKKTFSYDQLEKVNIVEQLTWLENEVKSLINDYNKEHSDGKITVDASLLDFASLYKPENDSVDVQSYIVKINNNLKQLVEQAKMVTDNQLFDQNIEVAVDFDATVTVKLSGTDQLQGLQTTLDEMKKLVSLGSLPTDVETLQALATNYNDSVTALEAAEKALQNSGILDNDGFKLDLQKITVPDFKVDLLNLDALQNMQDVVNSLNGNFKVAAKDLNGVAGISYDVEKGAIIATYDGKTKEVSILGKNGTPTFKITNGEEIVNPTDFIDFLKQNYDLINNTIGDLLGGKDNKTIVIEITVNGKTAAVELNIAKVD